MLKIFQIAFDYDEQKPLDQQSEHFHAGRDVMCSLRVAEHWAAGLYSHVANVKTLDLEHAFTVMNLWRDADEALVERLAPLHSLSVGDVVVDPAGVAHVVARFGFKPVSEAADND